MLFFLIKNRKFTIRVFSWNLAIAFTLFFFTTATNYIIMMLSYTLIHDIWLAQFSIRTRSVFVIIELSSIFDIKLLNFVPLFFLNFIKWYLLLFCFFFNFGNFWDLILLIYLAFFLLNLFRIVFHLLILRMLLIIWDILNPYGLF